jgi:hypothetical protein
MNRESHGSQLKEWTLMVYLAGDNNLESFGQRDLIEMKTVGSTDAINVVAQFDRMGDSVTRRYYLTHDSPLSADVVAELPETNTGDPAALLDFTRWALGEYPAKRTALILWNHGAGWKDDDIYALARQAGLSDSDLPPSQVRGLNRRSVGRSLFGTSIQTILQYPASVRAILFDDTSKDFLDNQELKRVLDSVLLERQGRKLDLIGFDACLMNMIEVADQVQHACAYMVGSQDIEPGDGWPYDCILAALAREPDAHPETLARIIVDAYGDYYTENPPGIQITQSALRLQQVPALVEIVGRLADGLIENLPDPPFYSQALLPAMRHAHKFWDQQYVDLGHFAQLLLERAGDGHIREVAAEVGAWLAPAADSAVVWGLGLETASARTSSFASGDARLATSESVQHVGSVHGLSIYLPLLGPVSPAYAGLEFTRHCGWGRFLEAFSKT